MKSPVKNQRPRAPRRFGIHEWMGGGWWAALGLSLVMIVAVRSGTVGAPAQNHVGGLAAVPPVTERLRTNSPQKAALERDLRAAARELAQARVALAAERERAAILQESYDGLNDQFSQVTELVRSSAIREASAALPSSEKNSVPAPVEAIFVLDKASAAEASASQ